VKEGDPPDVLPVVGGVTPAEILDDEHLIGWEEPQPIKKGYSNMQFLVFGGVLVALAYLTDEG
jgi:hypothetical protein